MKHWLFWHQPRSWRHRAFARAAMRLRHDPRLTILRNMRYATRLLCHGPVAFVVSDPSPSMIANTRLVWWLGEAMRKVKAAERPIAIRPEGCDDCEVAASVIRDIHEGTYITIGPEDCADFDVDITSPVDFPK